MYRILIVSWFWKKSGSTFKTPFLCSSAWKSRSGITARKKSNTAPASLEKGWNVKFKKAGRALCTLYPQEQFFHVMGRGGAKGKRGRGSLPAGIYTGIAGDLPPDRRME